jgi:hypothetical protein
LVLCLRAAVETIECQAEVEEILVVIEEIEVEADEEDSVEEAAVEEVVEEEDAVALGAAEDEVAPGVEVVVEAEVIVEVTVLTKVVEAKWHAIIVMAKVIRAETVPNQEKTVVEVQVILIEAVVPWRAIIVMRKDIWVEIAQNQMTRKVDIAVLTIGRTEYVITVENLGTLEEIVLNLPLKKVTEVKVCPPRVEQIHATTVGAKATWLSTVKNLKKSTLKVEVLEPWLATIVVKKVIWAENVQIHKNNVKVSQVEEIENAEVPKNVTTVIRKATLVESAHRLKQEEKEIKIVWIVANQIINIKTAQTRMRWSAIIVAN